MRVGPGPGYLVFHLPDLPDDLRRVAQVGLALRREADASCGPVDETRTQSLFDQPQPLGRRRRGEIERARRARQAFQPGKENEKLEIGCRVGCHFGLFTKSKK